MLGTKPEPETREDAARERIEYAEAFGLNPLDLDDADVSLVVVTDHLWQMGVLSTPEADARLRPLRKRINRGGEPTP